MNKTCVRAFGDKREFIAKRLALFSVRYRTDTVHKRTFFLFVYYYVIGFELFMFCFALGIKLA